MKNILDFFMNISKTENTIKATNITLKTIFELQWPLYRGSIDPLRISETIKKDLKIELLRFLAF